MRSLTRLCCALAVVALPLGFTFLPAAGATDAAFTVNSLADTPDASLTDGLCADANGACTLRAAIQQANADPSADAIGFGVTGTVNLTGALPDLSTDITISGPGSSLLTVRRDTGGDYRIFTVRAATVSISGLTVSNGQPGNMIITFFSGALGRPGGGIFNGGTLTLTGCVISGNISGIGGFPPLGPATFRGANGYGGGIYSEGRLTMNDCAVSNNTTREGGGAPGDGGGIYSTGELSMTGCTVSKNITGDNLGSSIAAAGAGIYARGRTRITNGVVSDNRGGPGGGVYNSGDMTAENTRFSGNSTADGASGGQNGFNGGGIANVNVMTLMHCTVSGNRTGKGSMAQAGGASSGSGGFGGGILNMGMMMMTDSTVSNNVTGDGADARLGVVGNAGSGGSGGGVYNNGPLTVTNSVVSGNRTGTGGASSGVNCSHGDGGDGGGIASPAGTMKLSQSTIWLNQTGLLGEPCGRDGLGGGLYGGGKLRSTIVSNNFVRSPGSAREVFGTGAGFESLGYNYIGIGSGCCFTSTDRHGSASSPGFNLHLDPTTLVPLPGSVALDAGLARDVDDQPVNTDKRGAARPFDFPAVPPQQGATTATSAPSRGRAQTRRRPRPRRPCSSAPTHTRSWRAACRPT
jgi:CSLREA domain-containing protein